MSLDPIVDKKIRAAFYAQAFMKTIGAEIHDVELGRAEITSPLGEAFLQHNGVGHAGLTFALGDTAAGFAAATTMTLDGNVLTTEMKINLLAPAAGERLRAVGRAGVGARVCVRVCVQFSSLYIILHHIPGRIIWTSILG